MKKDFQLMKAVIDTTRVNPIDRVKKIMEFHKKLSSTAQVVKELKDWELKLSNSLVNVPGRILPKERIYFGKSETIDSVNAEWDLNRQPKQFLGAAKLTQWLVICLEKDVQPAQVLTLV